MKIDIIGSPNAIVMMVAEGFAQNRHEIILVDLKTTPQKLEMDRMPYILQTIPEDQLILIDDKKEMPQIITKIKPFQIQIRLKKCYPTNLEIA